MTVRPEQRHKRRRPCRVCGGGDDDARGREKRCHGFESDDGSYVHCSREDLAGNLPEESGGTFAHRMAGPCRCGVTHLEAPSGSGPREPEAVYEYVDERGVLLFQVVRFPNKAFRQRRRVGGEWIWDTKGVRRTLYKLPELLASDPAERVYVVEGERDVETMWRLGRPATCNPGGAGKWSFVAEEARRVLKGRDVTVIADADKPGREHARSVVASLRDVAKSVRLMEAPAPSKDVSEYIESGGSPIVFDGAPVNDEAFGPTEASVLAPEIPFADLWAPEPDAELVVPGLGIAPGPVHAVVGSWYTGKTLFLMSLGLAVASGRDAFGMWKVRRGRWVHFDYEMGRRHIKRYLQRLARGMHLHPDDLQDRVSVRSLPRLTLTTEGAADLFAEILDGAALVTIDPLRSAARGIDENSSEIRDPIDLIASVSEKTRCPVMLLHHAGKATEGAVRRDTGRGSSSINDAAQTKFVLTAKEKGAPILVSHEKTRELTQTIPDFYLEIDNSDPAAVRLVHRDPEEIADEFVDEMEKMKAHVMKVVRGSKRQLKSANEVQARVGSGRNKCMAAIRELFDDGLLVQPGGEGCPIRIGREK